MSNFHTPVLLGEVIEALHIQPGKKYIDATVGGGGHSETIIQRGGIILGIDRDPEAIAEAQKYLESACFTPQSSLRGSASQKNANKALRSDIAQPLFRVVQGNFEKLSDLAQGQGFTQVSGILFDLGASTHQLVSPSRGFSFQHNAPLDMRMDPNLGVTAKDLVNALGKKELYDLFTNLAQEQRAWAIATHIVSARRQKPLETTGELARLVEGVYRYRRGKLHPATKVFQALRIAVNDELYSLTQVLPQALTLLEPQGRLVIISFHEGEDRIVKHFLKDQEAQGKVTMLTNKPITATADEVNANPNSRSARLRVAQKK